ncbi:MAG TPA: glycosyltransferase family 39 protein, partial [Candidatus Thermoplasmatota archaeon]|nr:glycosyltransferase family 39 protein [Candidatus Thermoplasmatota archaeon]
FLLHVWMGAFGWEPVPVRLLSALLGVGGVALTYVLGRDLFNPRAGLVAALLVAVSAFHLYYSQEARSYALLFTAAVAATHAYWLLFHTEGRRGAKLAYYVAAATAVLYAHYTGVFVVAAHALHRIVALAARPDRQALRLWLAAQAAVALLYLPWFLVLLKQAGRLQGNFWISEPTLEMVGGPPDFSVQGTLHQFIGGEARAWALWLLVANALVPSALAGLNRERTAQDDPHKPYPAAQVGLLVAWLLCSLLLPFFQSLVSQPIYLSRITIPALAPLMLLAGVGVARLRRVPVQAVAAALLVALAVPSLHAYHTSDAKERWDQALGTVGAEAAPNATVVLPSNTLTLQRIYAPRADLRIVPFGPAQETAAQARGATDVWMAGRQAPPCGQPNELAAALGVGRTLASCKMFMPEGLADFPLAANPVYLWHFTGCAGPCAAPR